MNRPARFPRTTNLLVLTALLPGAGCGAGTGQPLPNEAIDPLPADDYVLAARVAHISDAQIIDEESPARLTFAKGFVPFAYRPYERYSTQLLDGLVRAVNRYHEFVDEIDFVVHTGDAVDNHQLNELRWFLGVLDGGMIDPRSGPDDRAPDRRGPVDLDPHAPFRAQGLYRRGVHGERPSIPWYTVVGNHDQYALGVFPTVPDWLGGWVAPLPLPARVGLFLPQSLDPVAAVAYAPITPAAPGQPLQPAVPTAIIPTADRRYFTRREFAEAHFDTLTGPAGHGFDPADPTRTWYSVSPVAGLRLIALDSARPAVALPAGFYPEGAIDAGQIAFLRTELRAAQRRGELVLVLTHHPSADLDWTYGSAISTDAFRALLNEFPCVVAHLVGHQHRNRVVRHGHYVEFETASSLDFPQEGRIIELWTREGEVQLRYHMISHLPDESVLAQFAENPELAADPLAEMRLFAFELAAQNPVVEGVVPPLHLLEGAIENFADVISAIAEGLTTLGEGIGELAGEVAEGVGGAVGPSVKAVSIEQQRRWKSGAETDRTGVITLPLR